MSDAGAVQEREPEDDLRAAFAELKERDGSAAIVETTPEPVKPEPVNDGRARDEAGRFAKQEEKPEPVKPDAAAVAPAEIQAPATPAVKPPDGWTAEMKAIFATLDPKVQAEVSRRERELTAKITSADDERSFGRKLKEIASPYMATFNAEGATVEQGFQQFLNTAHILRQGTPQQKVQALMSVAQQFGVPLQNLIQQPQGNIVPHPAIETLQQRLDRIERDNQAKENQRQQQEQQALQSEIEAFSSDPKHIHFETVKAHMGALLQGGLAKDLQDAYDQACHAHPEIRASLTAVDLAAAEEKRIADQKAKAEAARKAAGSVTGGPGAATPPANVNGSVGSIEDDLRAAFRQVNGRV